MTYADIVRLLVGSFRSSLWPSTLNHLIYVSPIVLAICLGAIFWHVWVRYVRLKRFLGSKYTVLELRLPKDTYKSPLAMETVLHAIHSTSDGTAYDQYWKGKVRTWYSLEIVSFEGQVKFMIWTEDGRKANLMSALYAQYPGVEIYERDDYAKAVQFDPEKIKIWAAEFEFTKPDPYPIKTYVDFGLGDDPKEEFKVDPLTHIIEWMGSLGPNEEVWFQFIIRAHKKDARKPGHIFKKTDRWKDQAEEEVNTILMRKKGTKTAAGEPDPDTGYTKMPIISKGEQEIVAALERSVTKLPFDVCVRTLYIAEKEAFDTAFGAGGCISCMKQFNTEHLNGFRPNGKIYHNRLSGVPWEDYKGLRENRFSRQALMAYRRRSAFYPPYKTRTLVLNTEELATIYHLPGSVSATPGLERVPSKKAQAPTNLPV